MLKNSSKSPHKSMRYRLSKCERESWDILVYWRAFLNRCCLLMWSRLQPLHCKSFGDASEIRTHAGKFQWISNPLSPLSSVMRDHVDAEKRRASGRVSQTRKDADTDLLLAGIVAPRQHTFHISGVSRRGSKLDEY